MSVAEFDVVEEVVTVNQVELEVAVNVVGAVLFRLTVWETGVATPTVCERIKEAGVAVKVVVALFCTVKVTGKLIVVVPPVMAMEPE